MELKQTSPQSETVAAEIKLAVEAASAEHIPVADESKPAVRPDAEANAPAKPKPETSAEPALHESSADAQADEEAEPVEVISAEEAAEVTEVHKEPAQGSEEEIPAEAAEQPVVIADAAPEQQTALAANPAQETLPLAMQPEQTAEQKTAVKVAAALKARGEDPEQSPFSVIVSKVYDGPLDLLLDLIRKAKDTDIYDIPIAGRLRQQFLAYVDRSEKRATWIRPVSSSTPRRC